MRTTVVLPRIPSTNSYPIHARPTTTACRASGILQLPDRATVTQSYAQAIADLRKAESMLTANEGAKLSSQNIAESGTRKTMPKLAEVNGDTDYLELFSWWNALIDRYRLLLSNRLGAGKGGSTDNGASNQPDDNTGGSGGEEERPGEL